LGFLHLIPTMPIHARARHLIVVLAAFSGLLYGEGSIGIFQGIVVPGSAKESGKFIYIQSKNGNLRRVKVTDAEVYYGETVPVAQRTKEASECLKEAAEVRVAAAQGKNGEWTAKEIIILHLPRPMLKAALSYWSLWYLSQNYRVTSVQEIV
jgi:hypothetical protein